MKKFLIGFFFIFFDFWFRVGIMKIGLIPAVVGYILLIQGIGELAAESPRFGQVRVPAIIMAVWTGLSWVLDLSGLSVTVSGGAAIFSILLALAAAVISYWVSYNIVAGIGDIETANGVDLQAGRLKTMWFVLVICNLCSMVSLLVPVLTLVLVLVMLVSLIVFLCFFAKTNALYQEMKAAQAADADAPAPSEPAPDEPII